MPLRRNFRIVALGRGPTSDKGMEGRGRNGVEMMEFVDFVISRNGGGGGCRGDVLSVVQSMREGCLRFGVCS